jgi:hypothetical protein
VRNQEHENQEQKKDAKVADSEESATAHAMEADTTLADRQELRQSCYPNEEKLNIQQLIIIEPEKIIVSPELKAAEFIKARISGYNISGDEKATTEDNLIDNIQIETGDVISAKSIMVGESVANDVIIGKLADTFRGGTYFNYLNDLTSPDVYADYYQRKDLYQQTTADVIKTEAKSESPVYYPLKDSDRIKDVYMEVLKSELKVEEKDMHETKYGKFAFQEAMRDNPEISAWAGANEDRAMSVVGG